MHQGLATSNRLRVNKTGIVEPSIDFETGFLGAIFKPGCHIWYSCQSWQSLYAHFCADHLCMVLCKGCVNPESKSNSRSDPNGRLGRINVFDQKTTTKERERKRGFVNGRLVSVWSLTNCWQFQPDLFHSFLCYLVALGQLVHFAKKIVIKRPLIDEGSLVATCQYPLHSQTFHHHYLEKESNL